MNMIQRLHLVLTLIAVLAAPAARAAPTGEQAAPVQKPADIFSEYSLQDFCLDLRDRLTAGDGSWMTQYLSTDRIVQALSRQVPAFLRMEAGLDSPAFRNKLEANWVSRLAANLGNHKAVWMMTRFETKSANSAECTLTNDSYIEQDAVFYAIRLQLSHQAGRVYVVEAQDSLFNQPYSLMIGTLFSSILSEIDQTTDVSPLPAARPAGTFMQLVRSGDHRQIIDAYENRLSTAHQSLAVFQQCYLDAQAALENHYPEALALIVSRQPAGLASGYRLDLAYLQQKPAAVPPLLDLLEQAWGYHPGMDVLRLLAYQDIGDTDNVYRTFDRALVKNDGYSLTYWHMMRFLARQQRFAEALLMADILVKRFDYHLESARLAKDESLRDFAKSPLFREWLKKQQQSPG